MPAVFSSYSHIEWKRTNSILMKCIYPWLIFWRQKTIPPPLFHTIPPDPPHTPHPPNPPQSMNFANFMLLIWDQTEGIKVNWLVGAFLQQLFEKLISGFLQVYLNSHSQYWPNVKTGASAVIDTPRRKSPLKWKWNLRILRRLNRNTSWDRAGLSSDILFVYNMIVWWMMMCK